MAIWLTPQAECNRSVACGFAVPIALFADSSASRERQCVYLAIVSLAFFGPFGNAAGSRFDLSSR